MAKKYSSSNKDLIKSKKPAESTSSAAEKPIESSAPAPALQWILITIALVFILSLIGSMDNVVEKWTGLGSAVLILFILFVSKESAKLKEYFTPLFYSFLAYVVWGGLSTFYAASCKFAIFEFSKLLVALCVYITVLFFTNRNESGFKTVSLILASAGAFFGIISVDAASFGLLSKIFKAVLGVFTPNYSQNGLFEQGIRITSIFGNPNTYAGFMALAVILSLYLISSTSSRKNRIIAASLLGINALSYLLAFSMGSLFMFFIACLVMLLTAEKGSRISLFLIMLETAVITFIFAFVSMLGLGKSGFVAFLPLLAMALNVFCLYHADLRLRPVLSGKMNSNIKLLASTIVIIAVLVIGYTLAAFMVSGPMTLAANESVSRGLYLPAGDYSLQVESSVPVLVKVDSQNSYDLMRRSSTQLFLGPNQQEISFTVPDDSRIVMVNFYSPEDNNRVTNAEYSGAENGSVHLNYPLLPKIIANRIQNLFANENAVQRTIFFQDGMKLFSKSPVIGRGLGGFENGVYSVQDFYYETKYAHNHYIQALSDLGIVGLALFLSILAFSVISVVRARKKSRSLYAVPFLAACIVQMFGQALSDAVWSVGYFLGSAAAILALVTVFCAEPLKLKESFNKNALHIAEKTVLVVFTGVFVILLSGNLYAQAHAKAGVKDFDEIKTLIHMDRFEYNDYKLSYVVNAPKSGNEKVLAQADIYANELIKVESNSLAPYIVAYDFQRYYDYDAFLAAKQGIQHNRSNPYMWSKLFSTFEEYIDPVGPNMNDAADRLKSAKSYVDSVLEIYDMLTERNKNSLDDITLTPQNDAFIGKLKEIRATNVYGVDWVFTAIMTYAFDSACAVDADQDGLPDNLSILSGSATGEAMGVISVSENTVMDLNLYHKLGGKYTFKIETQTPQGIKIAYNDQEQAVTYTDDEAYVAIDLPDNTDQSISKFTVSYPTAAVIDAITFTTKLEK